MSPKRSLLVAVCVSLLFSLTACLPAPSTDNSESNFIVASNGQRGVPGYTPQGYDWKPNSQVEISIWDEPDGPDSRNGQWKDIFVENVDAQGSFGLLGSIPFYPVPKIFCGTPRNYETVLFKAISLTTGKWRMFTASAGPYFTYQPCH